MIMCALRVRKDPAEPYFHDSSLGFAEDHEMTEGGNGQQNRSGILERADNNEVRDALKKADYMHTDCGRKLEQIATSIGLARRRERRNLTQWDWQENHGQTPDEDVG